MAIWQDLVDDHGFTGRYNSVKRFVRKQRGVTTPEARVVIETAAGEEAQVDYGDGPMVRDPNTGKYRRMRMFVMTLGHSRKSVRLLVFRSSTQTWAELHEKAFRRLGGATRVVVLDNLREGVLTPDLYDPALNPLYRDVLKHYGAVALPCRVNDPDRKGKVESGVGHAQKTPLKGLFRPEGRERSITKMSMAGLPNGEWDDLNLFRKRVSGREIAVALDEHAADNEHRIVRRRYLRHSPAARLLSSRGRDEVVARLGARGAFADVGKIGVVRRIGELHAVVAAGHVRHVQDLRSFTEVQPADRRSVSRFTPVVTNFEAEAGGWRGSAKSAWGSV